VPGGKVGVFFLGEIQPHHNGAVQLETGARQGTDAVAHRPDPAEIVVIEVAADLTTAFLANY
jgi:hypothetical protein